MPRVTASVANSCGVQWLVGRSAATVHTRMRRSDHARAEIDVPADWAETARRLASGPAGRVFLLGAPDAGKSTLARFLCGEAGAAGRDVALLDADPAQKLVGPPACVTLGRAGESGDLALAALGFVAAVSVVHRSGVWTQSPHPPGLRRRGRSSGVPAPTCG